MPQHLKPGNPDALKISEVAEMLALGESTIYGLIARQSPDVPPSFKIGGKRFWSRQAVERWLADRGAIPVGVSR